MYEDHSFKNNTAVIAALKAQHGDEGLRMAVGGYWEWMGNLEASLLKIAGLRDGMRLIDLGCGSGRLAVVLAEQAKVAYHGIDIMPDLLDYARKNTPSDFQFSLVDKLEIPDADGVADMVCAFSLFTHLLHEETYTYLEEAKRVLKPGGVLVFSFLEFAFPSHWTIFNATQKDTKAGVRTTLNVFFERAAIEAWAKHLDLQVVRYIDGNSGDIAQLEKPLKSPDGTMKTAGNLGQSVCFLRKSG